MKKHWILWNLVGALVFVLLLTLGTSLGLNLITRHGKTVTAPDFTNMSLAEAQQAAREAKVGVKVTDSVFVKGLSGGVVFRQSPRPGANVKQGRSIFLTINSIVPKKVVMPNLVGYSIGEARSELRNRGLHLGRLIYVKDIATNQVLRQSMGDRTLEAGSLVVSGSSIDLTLGLSSESNTTIVPRLVGMKYIRAVDLLHEKCLNVGRVRCDSGIKTYSDSTQALVYRQDALGAVKSLGASVDIYLTLDPSKIPAQ